MVAPVTRPQAVSLLAFSILMANSRDEDPILPEHHVPRIWNCLQNNGEFVIPEGVTIDDPTRLELDSIKCAFCGSNEHSDDRHLGISCDGVVSHRECDEVVQEGARLIAVRNEQSMKFGIRMLDALRELRAGHGSKVWFHQFAEEQAKEIASGHEITEGRTDFVTPVLPRDLGLVPMVIPAPKKTRTRKTSDAPTAAAPETTGDGGATEQSDASIAD